MQVEWTGRMYHLFGVITNLRRAPSQVHAQHEAAAGVGLLGSAAGTLPPAFSKEMSSRCPKR